MLSVVILSFTLFVTVKLRVVKQNAVVPSVASPNAEMSVMIVEKPKVKSPSLARYVFLSKKFFDEKQQRKKN